MKQAPVARHQSVSMHQMQFNWPEIENSLRPNPLKQGAEERVRK
jgi:hypothetical protein